METFTMSRKELPRPGLIQAALAGQITNREAAGALQLSVRQFQRLKARVRLGGPLGAAAWDAGPAVASSPASRRVRAGAGVAAGSLRGLQ
jgi:hypothetical protein